MFVFCMMILFVRYLIMIRFYVYRLLVGVGGLLCNCLGV